MARDPKDRATRHNGRLADSSDSESPGPRFSRHGGHDGRGRGGGDSDRGRRGQDRSRDRDRDKQTKWDRSRRRGGGSHRRRPSPRNRSASRGDKRNGRGGGRGGRRQSRSCSRSERVKRAESDSRPRAAYYQSRRKRQGSHRAATGREVAGARSRSRSCAGRSKSNRKNSATKSKAVADHRKGAPDPAKGALGRKGGGGSSSSSSGPRNKKKPSEDSDSGTDDDEIIHFDWKEDMVLNSRYKLLSLAGDGTFGRVVMAHDQREDRKVAIKIIRDVKRYMENAQIEANILKDIRKADPDGKSMCSIMYETFTHNLKFYCLVLDPLGMSLYDFLKDNDYRGYWLQDIQDYARQSMEALAFLHDKLKLTHTDLKPENVLLHTTRPARASSFPREAEWLKQLQRRNEDPPTKQYMRPVSSAIKIIDFGNATYAEEQHTSTINTRQYRGPEVLLSCGWNELSDQWSIGCILMELYTGNQLFETHEEMEHLALMERIIDPFTPALCDAASRSARDKWFTQQGSSGRTRLAWPDRASSASSERHVASQRPLHKQVPPEHAGLTDFVADLLVLDPRKRKSAAAMLSHRFLTKMKFED